MARYNGQLRSNIIFALIYNMIISQQVENDNLGNHQNIVNDAKVDGSMYGDTKLFYATDVLASYAWGNDAEANNLLALHRPKAPNCQAFYLDQFRQIPLTVDNYLSKQAWGDEYAFSSFNSVMLGWMGETKRMYESRLYNVFLGTTETSTGKQKITRTFTAGAEGKELAQLIADLTVELGDYTRDYNDLGYMRSYSPQDIQIIFNAQHVNKITYNELPAVFHKEEIESMFKKAKSMPDRYFGTTITDTNKDTYADNTPAASKPLDKDGNYAYTPGVANANGCVRTTVEVDVKVNNVDYHLFPGDEIPAGTKLSTVSAAGTLLFGQVYIQAGVGGIAPVYAKVYTKLPPMMSAFEVGTSFFNPKSLTENHYLTWGYNTLDYFQDKPFITIKKA